MCEYVSAVSLTMWRDRITTAAPQTTLSCHTWIRHVTRKGVISFMSHGTCHETWVMSDMCYPTYEWVTCDISHMSQCSIRVCVTHGTSHLKESCHLWMSQRRTHVSVTNSYFNGSSSNSASHAICKNGSCQVWMILVTRECNMLERQHHRQCCNTLQNTATHCNTLRHSATHCNTLRHTAPHCNGCCVDAWFKYTGMCDIRGIHTCDMTSAYVLYDPSMCAAWLLHTCTCPMTHVSCVTTHVSSHEWHVMSHIWMSHGLYAWLETWSATWLVHTCDTTPSHDIPHLSISLTLTWRIHMSDMTPSYVWHDAFIHVTWLIHICDTTRSYVSHDFSTCVK